MNKFEKNLSANNKEIRKERAGRISKTLKMSAQSVVNTLETEVLQLESKIEEFTDLAPTHTTSLKFDSIDDGSKWFKELLEIKQELALKKIDLDLAKELQKEWFDDGKEA